MIKLSINKLWWRYFRRLCEQKGENCEPVKMKAMKSITKCTKCWTFFFLLVFSTNFYHMNAICKHVLTVFNNQTKTHAEKVFATRNNKVKKSNNTIFWAECEKWLEAWERESEKKFNDPKLFDWQNLCVWERRVLVCVCVRWLVLISVGKRYYSSNCKLYAKRASHTHSLAPESLKPFEIHIYSI